MSTTYRITMVGAYIANGAELAKAVFPQLNGEDMECDSASVTVTFDTSILSAYYQAKAGLSLANNGAQSSGSSSSTKKAPTAPAMA